MYFLPTQTPQLRRHWTQDNICSSMDGVPSNRCISGEQVNLVTLGEVRDMVQQGTGVPINALPEEWARDCSLYGSINMPVETALLTLTTTKKVGSMGDAGPEHDN
eukprot:scaffold940_cov569-Prasinococcus_capsulatus_cf.AAC.9